MLGLGLAAVLVTIVIVAIAGQRTVTQVPAAAPSVASLTACQADRQAVETAAQEYEAVHGAPPPGIAALVPQFLAEVPSGAGFTVSLVTGTTTAVGSLPGC